MQDTGESGLFHSEIFWVSQYCPDGFRLCLKQKVIHESLVMKEQPVQFFVRNSEYQMETWRFHRFLSLFLQPFFPSYTPALRTGTVSA